MTTQNQNEEKLDIVVEGDEAEPQIEVVDDTPEKDRRATPAPDIADPDEEELNQYSGRVKERIAQLTLARHEERRKAEAYQRQLEESTRVAAELKRRAEEYQSTLNNGYKEYFAQAKRLAELEVERAKRNLRDANETGDTDKLVEAQAELAQASAKLSQVTNYRPELTQEKNTDTYTPTPPRERVQVPTPTARDLSWQEQNKWFGQNQSATAFALGAHQELVDTGYVPGSDAYYRELDSRIKGKFPELTGSEAADTKPQAQSNKPKSTPVVAGVQRVGATNKVVLTKTQVAMAKRLGISLEAYAKEFARLEKQNG